MISRPLAPCKGSSHRGALGLILPAALVATLVLQPSAASLAAGKGEPDWRAAYRRPAEIPFPADDPFTKAKADLGRMLFFDPILSGSNTQSCASCHNPGLSWTDGLKHGIGEKPMATHTPTLLNIAWIPVLGWRGQFPDLKVVALTPMTKPGIMNQKVGALVGELKAIPGYVSAFKAAFPGGTISADSITSALATFERTIVSGPAPFDLWIEGDEEAISDEAKKGFALFRGKAQCAECHRGWNFTDMSFYDVGVGGKNDLGRGKMFPDSVKLQHAFKVPTLRDVARRAPYMHDGSEATLMDVIDLYDRGGIDRPSRSELIKPLHLTQKEKAQLVAFLKTLTSKPVKVIVPELPR